MPPGMMVGNMSQQGMPQWYNNGQQQGMPGHVGSGNSGALPPGMNTNPSGNNTNNGNSNSNNPKSGLPDRRDFDIVMQYGSKNANFIATLDERVKAEATTNKGKEWFLKDTDNIDKGVVDVLFTSSLKKTKNDELPLLKTKVNVKDLNVYRCDPDRKYEQCSYDQVKKNKTFICTIEITGIWFIKSGNQPVKNFGIAFKTTSIMIFEKPTRPKFNFILADNYEQAPLKRKRDEEEEEEEEEGAGEHDHLIQHKEAETSAVGNNEQVEPHAKRLRLTDASEGSSSSAAAQNEVLLVQPGWSSSAN